MGIWREGWGDQEGVDDRTPLSAGGANDEDGYRCHSVHEDIGRIILRLLNVVRKHLRVRTSFLEKRIIVWFTSGDYTHYIHYICRGRGSVP
jgi:hypothetical protein